jgi:hypothetical protein
MQWMRLSTFSMLLLTLTLASACNSRRDEHSTSQTGETKAQAAQNVQSGCWVEAGKRTEFVGTPECMRQLPQTRMNGVWVRGFEYSVFFEGATRAPEWHTGMPQPEVWFETYPDDAMDRFGFKFDGTPHAFLIDFIGAKSDAPGFYGHFGMFKHGVLATHILTVREIPLPAQH